MMLKGTPAGRLLMIGETQVAITHAGGAANVPIDSVPLDVLARAHIELKAKAEERKKQADVIARQDAERRSHTGVQAEKVNAVVAAPAMIKLSPTNSEQRLIGVKSRFPAQRTVKIKRNDVTVPIVDFWRSVKSEAQVATLQSLPISIRKMEERTAAELKRLEAVSDRSEPSRQEAIRWIKQDLAKFIADMRALN
jgi:hypothetical protein